MTRETAVGDRVGLQENGHRTDGKPHADKALSTGPRVSRLDTLANIRAELSRVYRASRRAEGHCPDSKAGLRLAMMLSQLRTLVEVASLEARIEELERRGDDDQ